MAVHEASGSAPGGPCSRWGRGGLDALEEDACHIVWERAVCGQVAYEFLEHFGIGSLASRSACWFRCRFEFFFVFDSLRNLHLEVFLLPFQLEDPFFHLREFLLEVVGSLASRLEPFCVRSL